MLVLALALALAPPAPAPSTAKPPSLPAPFHELAGVCVTSSCGIKLYAPKNAGVVGGAGRDSGERMLGTVVIGPGVSRCLMFSEGPSEDPALVVWKAERCASVEDDADQDAMEIMMPGEVFIVPGNGVLYTTGSTNATFNVRQKWTRAANGTWKASPQPFFYVGERVVIAKVHPVTEERTQPVKLLAERKANAEVIATVAPGSTVEILLAEPQTNAAWFLVRTELGLVGWYQSPSATGIVPDALGIYFHGD